MFAGVDYHFYREEIFISLENGSILYYSVSVSETETGTLRIELSNPSPKEVYTTTEDISLGDIAVDWLRDILYWIESDTSNTKVCTVLCVHSKS